MVELDGLESPTSPAAVLAKLESGQTVQTSAALGWRDTPLSNMLTSEELEVRLNESCAGHVPEGRLWLVERATRAGVDEQLALLGLVKESYKKGTNNAPRSKLYKLAQELAGAISLGTGTPAEQLLMAAEALAENAYALGKEHPNERWRMNRKGYGSFFRYERPDESKM